MKKAFDNKLYLKIQKEKITERINQFNGKLYLEFGGKLFDDYHASRVLPGFEPDSKIQMLLGFKKDVEAIIAVNSFDIEANKIRSDNNVSYSNEVERLLDAFKEINLNVAGVVLSFYHESNIVKAFETKLLNNNVKVYHHYQIEGYPDDLSKVCSNEGFGKNDYIETTKSLVIVTAPGPGSGKMATCLSQLYHDSVNGKLSGYAKYETFPVWNLSINNPVNIAYVSATVDLNDLIMIDQYHLEAYGTYATNYNRDIESFPILKNIFDKIYTQSPYKSPTDMGVNMIGFAISDEEEAFKASKNEIIRRYYQTLKYHFLGQYKDSAVEKAKAIMNKIGLTTDDRKCVKACLNKAELTNVPSMAIELSNNKIITSKRSDLLQSSAALILNTLKYYAKIDDSIPLISKSVIDPIINLKENELHQANPRLHVSEVLYALAIQASTNPLSDLALKQIPKLKGLQAHSSVILDEADLKTLKKMGIDVTEEPATYAHRLYVK